MDVTENQHETYERLIETEDRLLRQLGTCEMTQEAVLDQQSAWAEPLDLETIETILKGILELDAKLRLELLNLRLEKKKLGRKLRRKAP